MPEVLREWRAAISGSGVEIGGQSLSSGRCVDLCYEYLLQNRFKQTGESLLEFWPGGLM